MPRSGRGMILSKLHGKMVTSLGAAFAAVAMVP